MHNFRFVFKNTWQLSANDLGWLPMVCCLRLSLTALLAQHNRLYRANNLVTSNYHNFIGVASVFLMFLVFLTD